MLWIMSTPSATVSKKHQHVFELLAESSQLVRLWVVLTTWLNVFFWAKWGFGNIKSEFSLSLWDYFAGVSSVLPLRQIKAQQRLAKQAEIVWMFMSVWFSVSISLSLFCRFRPKTSDVVWVLAPALKWQWKPVGWESFGQLFGTSWLLSRVGPCGWQAWILNPEIFDCGPTNSTNYSHSTKSPVVILSKHWKLDICTSFQSVGSK